MPSAADAVDEAGDLLREEMDVRAREMAFLMLDMTGIETEEQVVKSGTVDVLECRRT